MIVFSHRHFRAVLFFCFPFSFPALDNYARFFIEAYLHFAAVCVTLAAFANSRAGE